MDIDELFDVFNEPPTSFVASKASITPAEVTEQAPEPSFESLKELISSAKRTEEFDGNSNQVKKQKVEENDVNSSNEVAEVGKTDEYFNNAIKDQKVRELLSGVSKDVFASRIITATLSSESGCLHEVCFPPSVEYEPLKPAQDPPAVKFPFPLDPFQKEAILCVENSQDVLVSAHTSAGKTVIAEYAIGKSFRDGQRVIYTTPIKALSNQKYREFCEKFEDKVGIMTGDVTLNPSAACVVMTTEILRSMLYRGSMLLREVGWVIFDEIHYMRDKDRGVVWEESIILQQHNVHSVFLSATIPNARQFAEWICSLHNQPCHVVYTEQRPVPLQQFIFPYGASTIYLVVDENGTFNNEYFNRAMDDLQVMQQPKKFSKPGSNPNCKKIVQLVMDRDLGPAICFCFSKRECEAYATQLTEHSFNSEKEKKAIQIVFENAIACLSEDDQKIPQVQTILPILQKGIGIHHSGLLPILKETVEILFSEGLIKVLFATETFAMGLNMPARTVVFTNARKFDGKDFRWITSGEYIQMSGRAGRRGIDEKGIVILMIDEKMTPSAAKNIVKGQPDPINSAFHLTYNMVLNLLRVDGIDPEFIMEKSFFQFQGYCKIPQLYEEAKKIADEYSAIEIPEEESVMLYAAIQKRISSADEDMFAITRTPRYSLPFLRLGRLIKVKLSSLDFGWGVVVSYQRRQTSEFQTAPNDLDSYIVTVYLRVSEETSKLTKTSELRPPSKGRAGVLKVVPISMTLIHDISSVCFNVAKDLPKEQTEAKILDSLLSVEKSFPTGVPLLHPVADMKIRDKTLLDALERKEAFQKKLDEHPLKDNPNIENWVDMYREKAEIATKLKDTAAEFRKTQSLVKMEDLKCMKRVLRRLGFCTPSDIVEDKGRVACEISNGHELLLTEMIYSGSLNALNPHQISAICSCFVFEEKAQSNPKFTEELQGPLRVMQEKARAIALVSKESKLETDVDEYVNSLKTCLMEVVYEWSKGKNFAEICQMTDVFEGSIIRCFRRLYELLTQMSQASRAIGNTMLEQKFSESIKFLKRDIAFAGSLYL